MAVQLLNETNVMALPIDDIKPNPYQQRKYFDFYSLNRLTESIKKYGVIQPVTVSLLRQNIRTGGRRKTSEGGKGGRTENNTGLFLSTPTRKKAPLFLL